MLYCAAIVHIIGNSYHITLISRIHFHLNCLKIVKICKFSLTFE